MKKEYIKPEWLVVSLHGNAALLAGSEIMGIYSEETEEPLAPLFNIENELPGVPDIFK